LKSRQYNAGRFPAPAICTRAGFFDIGGVDPNKIPDDVNDLLDAEAALIPRMILILRKLARIREAAGRPVPLPRREKIGRNDPCPYRAGP
jgi:hypothetical protein